MKRWVLLVGAVAGAVAAIILLRTCGQKTQPETQADDTLVARPCEYRSVADVSLECNYLNLEQAGGAQLSLAVLSQSAGAAVQPPLVYLAGGPGVGGNTAGDRLAHWLAWYQRMGFEQDLVIVDFRAVPLSRPHWDCHEYLRSARQLWQRDLPYAEEAALSRPVLQNCYRQFEKVLQRGSAMSVAQLSSEQNAADVEQAMLALGYQQWDLLGVSYGTRVALVAALTQERVRRVVLDSPYPLSHGQLSDLPRNWAQAFARYFRACDAGKWGCEPGAHSESLFWQAVDQLEAEPIRVTVDDWSSQRPVTWVLNGQRFAAVMFSTFYSSELYSRIYPALQGLARRETGAAQLLLEFFYNQAFDPSFNNMVFWATECNDNYLESEPEYQAALAESGRFAALFANDWQSDICREAFFSAGQKPAMASLNKPVLLAAGLWDPVTPAVQAESLLEWLPQGFYLPLPEHAHAEFFNGECAAVLLPWFFSAESRDLSESWASQKSRCR